ncbi:group II intron reverse transcriptase/maturase [Pseudomonas sp. R11-23-07]|uniref:group II intron reverse transcriptase/maturase n=1 Tax=Pseudomonas sp. R11-23-07 TaxID=658632 RepID=UPI000F55BEC5|nr:group II intron reverse transcriptase/maturase [Pseudomonas sp. R11-23-07]AZF58932.1 Retron-type RNA-directed DNA polymerase [Pseudomonas sp. R11-23-07]
MTIQQAMQQMPGQPGREATAKGESPSCASSVEAGCPRHDPNPTGEGLLQAALSKENLLLALKRVRSNKGVAGVDGLTIDETVQHLKTAWPGIRSQLLAGEYRPAPVRRVLIPKPDGGERKLGIPTVTDRLIQQALLQVLQPLLDPGFSEHSYGFRPGRSAHQAVLAAQQYIHSGRQVVVDVDIEQFFDCVNHDLLIARLSRRVTDRGVLCLIRAHLNCGTLIGKDVVINRQGTPQGGPLSPLLANVVLDEVDKELERRGHCFVRYADDANVYVRSPKAGLRVMAVLQRLYGRLGLRMNEGKSAVASVFGRKFLGYGFWLTPDGKIRRWATNKALQAFKQRIRELTSRNGGRSLEQVIGRLRPYLLGWKAYFCLSQTIAMWKRLDGWIRRRLRAIQLKQWKTGRTTYRELCRMGATPDLAAQIAVDSHRIWHNSAGLIHSVLTVAWFDRLGLPRLS